MSANTYTLPMVTVISCAVPLQKVYLKSRILPMTGTSSSPNARTRMRHGAMG